MSIQIKGLAEISSAARTAYQKAQDASKRSNFEYAVEILKGIIQSEPGFTDGRNLLRKVEKEKSSKLGAVAKIMANIKISLMVAKGRTLIGKKPLDAMKIAEDALALYLYAPAALNLLADAAESLKAYSISIEALELIDESNPKNLQNLKKLAQVYESAKMGCEVLKVRQRIVSMKPGDLGAEQDLRAAAALASMQTGNMDKEDLNERLKNKSEAAELEQEDKIVRDINDIAILIEKYEKMIAEGDVSIDNRRKLAEYYQRGNRHDDAIAIYEWITKKMGALDPTIDRLIEKSMVAKFKEKIAALKGANASEADINQVETEMYNYKQERAVDRVTKYPNDTQLRYDLAVVYWDGGFVENALEQFQYSKKNPQRRVSSVVYLGRCFFAKEQYDMAVDQFTSAIAEMNVMDDAKMDALYDLGVTYERIQNKDKAVECFKQIYQANINYRDVSAKMNQFYKK